QNLDHWALAGRGLKRADTSLWSVAYQGSDPLVAPVDDSVVAVSYRPAITNTRRSHTISEQAAFEVKGLKAVSLGQLQRAYVSPLQNLLILATGTPAALEELQITS